MGHSQPEYYLHLVWATYQREPLLVGETEDLIYACIRAELRRMDCRVLTLGGIADHVHLAVEPTTLLGPALLMKQIKGVSSRFASSKGIALNGKQATAFVVWGANTCVPPCLILKIRNGITPKAPSGRIGNLRMNNGGFDE